MTATSPVDTSNYYTYTWNPGNYTGASYTVTPAATTTYTVLAQSATGCGNYGLVTVNVNTRPVIQSLTASNSTICQGASTQLSVTLGQQSGPQNDPGNYANPSFSSTLDEEIFNVTLGTINNTSTCTSVAPGPGSVNSSYSNYTTSIPPTQLIMGTNYTGSVTVGYCGTFAYSNMFCVFIDWNRDGDFLDVNETVYTSPYQSYTFPGNTPVSFSVSVPSTALAGVTRMRVVVNESSLAPTPTQVGTWGEGEDYLVNVISAGAGSSFAWTPGNLSGQTVTVTPAATTNYTVTVTAFNGCTQTGTTTVSVLPFNPPTGITANGPTTFCQGGSVVLDAGAGYDNYLWSNGVTTQTTTVTASGNYSVTVSNNNGCSGTMSRSVTVLPFTAPVINSNRPSICEGVDLATLSVSGSYTSYLWSNGATTSSITVSTGGNYTVTVTNASGCSGSSSYVLAGSPAPLQPIVIIPSTDTLYYCWDGVTPGSVFVMADVQGEPVNVWNDPLGSTGDFAILSIGNGPIDYGFGSHLVSVTSIGAGACTAVDSFRLIVVANPVPVISGSSTICTSGGGSTAILDAGSGYASFSWTDASGAPVGSSRYFTATTPGTYTVTVTNAAGCTGSATKTVTGLNPSSSSTTEVACDSYLWNGNTYTASGIYNYTTIGANGCDSVATLELTINNSVIVNQNVTACQSYTDIFGTVYTQSGVYSSFYSTDAGCDSTVNLNLTIDTTCSPGINLTVTAFIEGYYAGFNSMTPVLTNEGIANTTGNETDTITIELHDATDPTIVVESVQAMLMVDGTATATLTTATAGSSYWIAIKHRNAIQTWSAAEVLFSATTTYDFTTADTQAYGANMKEVEPGVWAFYSGDISQDEFVDSFDYGALEADNLAFASGYLATDLNGDGFVDSFDYSIFEINNLNFVMSSHP